MCWRIRSRRVSPRSAVSCSRVIKYRVVEDLHKLSGRECAIERIEDDLEPVRFPFDGTREEAEAVVRKLSDLMKRKEAGHRS